MGHEQSYREMRGTIVEEWLDGDEWATHLVETFARVPHCNKCGRFHDTKYHQNVWKSKKRLL